MGDSTQFQKHIIFKNRFVRMTAVAIRPFTILLDIGDITPFFREAGVDLAVRILDHGTLAIVEHAASAWIADRLSRDLGLRAYSRKAESQIHRPDAGYHNYLIANSVEHHVLARVLETIQVCRVPYECGVDVTVHYNTLKLHFN